MFKAFVLLIIASLAMSVSVQANTDVQIQDFDLWTSTYGDETIRVIPSSAINPDGCTNPDSYMVDPTLSEKNTARIFSSLLAAVIGKREVIIIINGCTNNRPKITTVRIR